ncbi:MAG: PD-(D/E)XK nuclease family transposase [Rhodoferax sp.]|nr:PD-(D/E)XK nuclease family transposase [Rhodoferax sp.]
MRFLDVQTDFAFNKVFGSQQSKPVLIDFLNAILDLSACQRQPGHRRNAGAPCRRNSG